MAATERAYGARSFEEDEIPTSGGPLVVTSIGHGSLMLAWRGLVVHVDPVSAEARYEDLPPAGLILITHSHGDHFDPAVIDLLCRPDTEIVMTEGAFAKIKGTRAAARATIARNGERLTARGSPSRRSQPTISGTSGPRELRSTRAARATGTSSRSPTRGSTSPATPKTRPRCALSGAWTWPSFR